MSTPKPETPITPEAPTGAGAPPDAATAPPAAPAVDVTQTPEFKDAVAAAVATAIGDPAELRKRLLADMKADMKSEMPDFSAGIANLRDMFVEQARAQALANAEISDQGTNRKRVAPEILAARDAAGQRMGNLLLEAQRNNLQPRYRLIGKCVFHEQLVEPFTRNSANKMVPTEVIWVGAPNEAMRPINDVAKAIFDAFLASIGGSADVNGRSSQPLWITKTGVIITGSPTTAQHNFDQVSTPDRLPLAAEFVKDPSETQRNNPQGGFAITNGDDPEAPFIHVLGTVAAPARRNIDGKAA